MTRARLLVLLGLLGAPLVLSVGTFVACSTGKEANPTSPPVSGTGAGTLDGSSDGTAPVGPTVTCTMVDIGPGAGPKFCDLPGGTDAPGFEVPAEFCVREFTINPIIESRVLRFAPNGDLFVAAPSMVTPGGALDGPGSIIVLPDDDHDGRADGVVTYAGPFPRNGMGCANLETDPKNLSCVHGLAFAGNYLYFTRSDEVRRFAYKSGDRAAPATSEVVAQLDGRGLPDVRWTHTLEVPKDGSLYVSRGRMDTSLCNPAELERGAVFQLHIEKQGTMPLTPELVANGFRNPMYLRCSPSSCGDCYASELTGDNWDGIGGEEKLALLGKKGESWGFPCCVGRGRPANGAAAQICESVGLEHTSIPLHDTNFGLDFDRGGFPPPYKHGLFVALHGAVTKSSGTTGVVWVRTDPTSLRPMDEVKPFLKGFGVNGARATDVAFAPDGRMFIADDTKGRIYWVAPRDLRRPL